MATDVIVIGAGHAGCEAALAAARTGAQVTVVTLKLDGIAQMSCNPAIGGVGKGHLVREIDALGGAMAQVADETGIQFRVLNTSRGPAVRSTRVQVDSLRYRLAMADRLKKHSNITLHAGEVVEICQAADGQVTGVRTSAGTHLQARAVVVTTGTFLRAQCFVGEKQQPGGRMGEQAAGPLSLALQSLGITLKRFKTGTTPRLAAESIDWHLLEPQLSDVPEPRLSFDWVQNRLPRLPCAITYTTPATHQVVRDNLHASPLYQGIIEGLGPRYCPSLEDKVVRFAQRERHQVFLEPESLSSERVYPAGISTSLPQAAQDAFLHSIPGLERCRVLQYGYAVEYDYAPPMQLSHALMVKALPGLFLAGQINGTSGYEEAACQGLMAGLNAVRWLNGQQAAVLRRSDAYIGVLIDDLVTRGVDEPYRIFTSRAEHRLTLRESTAEERLSALATQWGLIDAPRQQRAAQRAQVRASLYEQLSAPLGASRARAMALSPSEYAGKTCQEVLRMPNVPLQALLPDIADDDQSRAVAEAVKFSGYIARERKWIDRLASLDTVKLPQNFDFAQVTGLTTELYEKLKAVRPQTLGQASRISGMTPAAVGILQVAAHRRAPAERPNELTSSA